MDQDGAASDSGNIALGSVAGAADQELEAGEAMVADSNTAEAMLEEDGAAEDMEANSMSAEPDVQSVSLGTSEAAAADGHPPQMAVLASLDQVCMPSCTAYPSCVPHAHLRQVCMPPLTTCLEHAHTPKQLLNVCVGHSGYVHACMHACSLRSVSIMPLSLSISACMQTWD